MQTWNTFLKVLALVTLTATLTACGGGGASTGGGTNSTGSGQTPTPPPTPEPTPTPEPEPTPDPEPTPTPTPEPEPTPDPEPTPPQPATFSATLNWNIPSSREDGTTLEMYEIGGYEIQYKLVSDSQYTSIVISDETRDRYEITGLNAGTYEFRIATFDIDNVYSQFSTPQSASIGS